MSTVNTCLLSLWLSLIAFQSSSAIRRDHADSLLLLLLFLRSRILRRSRQTLSYQRHENQQHMIRAATDVSLDFLIICLQTSMTNDGDTVSHSIDGMRCDIEPHRTIGNHIQPGRPLAKSEKDHSTDQIDSKENDKNYHKHSARTHPRRSFRIRAFSWTATSRLNIDIVGLSIVLTTVDLVFVGIETREIDGQQCAGRLIDQ